MKTVINLELARKILGLANKGFCRGLGIPQPGQMCVEAAVAYACGEDHNDTPSCVHQEVSNFKIEINDEGFFYSDKDRGKQLRRIAIAQLGSKDVVKNNNFSKALWRLFNKHPIVLKEIENNLKIIARYSDQGQLIAMAMKYPKLKKIATINLNELLDDIRSDIDLTTKARINSGVDYDSFPTLLPNLKKRKLTLLAIELGIAALRNIKSPGVKLMDKLIAEGVI